jgi:DNA-binding FadR family transcriptional regulator
VGGPAFTRVLETVGRAVVRGELEAGHVDTVEGIGLRTGASRSIVREATRVLVSLGLLSAGRRVGLTVLGRQRWDVLDPAVIRWRLDSPDRDRQIDELRDLRLAVEPEAARSAASRRSAAQARSIVEAGLTLVEAASTADPRDYLEADQRLHGLVLTASGNTMFVRLRAVIDAALAERALHERAALPPDPVDVRLHGEMAAAVASGDSSVAASLMREIVARTTVAGA